MIGVIDYGLGNITAFLNSFKRLNISAKRICSNEDLSCATHFILPGVGHFDHAMKKFKASGLLLDIEKRVFQENIPLMGVCVGMQMLGMDSAEGSQEGLGWLSGRTKCLKNSLSNYSLEVPHMGWNSILIKKNNRLLDIGNSLDPQFYFLHSYYFEANNDTDVLGTTAYGREFDVIVARNNIFGVQFHPEKSHHWGLQLLNNFALVK